MNGEQFGKENSQPPQASFPTTRGHNMVSNNVFGSLFSGLSNCQVTVSPKNLVVNISHSVLPPSHDPVCNVLDGTSLEQLLD